MANPTSGPGSGPGDGRGAGEAPGKTGEMSKADRARFERRVADLDAKLDKVRAPDARARSDNSRARTTGRGMAYGLRMASELVAAVLIGAAIGYGLDHWLGTSGPWFFLLFFTIGFAAGIVNILRAYKRLQAEINAETGGYIGEDLPDDDE